MNQLAKSIVDEATSDSPAVQAEKTVKQKAGKKGGRARALQLSPDERSRIASIAAQARWKKTDS